MLNSVALTFWMPFASAGSSEPAPPLDAGGVDAAGAGAVAGLTSAGLNRSAWHR